MAFRGDLSNVKENGMEIFVGGGGQMKGEENKMGRRKNKCKE